MAKAKKTYTDAQLYSGRAVTITYKGKEIAATIVEAGGCSASQFCITAPEVDSGMDTCVARSTIVRLGT